MPALYLPQFTFLVSRQGTPKCMVMIMMTTMTTMVVVMVVVRHGFCMAVI